MSAVSVDHRNRHNGRSERRESAGSLLCPPHSETAAVLLMLCWTRRRLGVGSSKPWTHRLRDAPLADLVAGGYLVTNLCARAREMALTGTPCRRCFRNHRHDPVDRRVDSPPASRDARCSLRDRPLRGIGLGRARDRDRLRYCADTLPRGVRRLCGTGHVSAAWGAVLGGRHSYVRAQRSCVGRRLRGGLGESGMASRKPLSDDFDHLPLGKSADRGHVRLWKPGSRRAGPQVTRC